jgi:hypothetical protein
MGGASDYKMNDSIYEEFLYTEIGEQENGMPLSMVSALTRLGLDPWDEARRLASLPAAAAAAAVSDLIKRTSARATELPKLSARMAALLSRPAPVVARVVSLPGVPPWLLERRWLAVLLIVGVLIVVSKLFLLH